MARASALWSGVYSATGVLYLSSCLSVSRCASSFFNLSIMPRDRGGIGRTGQKHLKKSQFDINRRCKSTVEGSSSDVNVPAISKQNSELESANDPSAGVQIFQICKFCPWPRSLTRHLIGQETAFALAVPIHRKVSALAVRCITSVFPCYFPYRCSCR